MMNFRLVIDSLIGNVLGPAEKGRFRVIGYQDQKRAAEEVFDCLRTVQVFYENGNFPKSGGRRTGPGQHDIIIAVDLTVSQAVKADLKTINNGSTAEKILALEDMQNAAELAEKSTNELIDIIYNILMDGRNVDLGLSEGIVANRWIERIEKKEVSGQGEYVVLGAVMNLSCRVEETPCGDEGTIIDSPVYDNTIDIDNDDVEKTGVIV
jgi:hypothetical protein